MRGFFYVLAAVAVIGLAFWAYRETHQTQRAVAELRHLQRDISALREAIDVQRAEWAYLSRPDRLRDLVSINFDRLQLLPVMPEQFGDVEQVAYPPPEIPVPIRPEEAFAVTGQDGATGAATTDDSEERP